MDTKYINNLYKIHIKDDDEKLKKIISTPDKYSQEAVYVAKKILSERKEVLKNESQFITNKTPIGEAINEDIITICESIRRNTETIKNLFIFIIVLFIICSIISIL